MDITGKEKDKSIFNNIHAVMLLIDPDTADIIDANSAALEFYGYSLEAITGMKITDINILTKEQVFNEMRMAKTEQRMYFVFRHRLANGDIRDVEVYSGPVVIEGREVLFSIIHDISKRIQAEEALKQSEERLSRICDATFEGIAISDRGAVVDANEQLAKLLGYSRSEIIGKSISKYIAPESLDIVQRHIKEKYENAYEIVILKQDGSRIYAEVRGREINYQGRQVRETVIRDITDRKQAEELIHKERNKFQKYLDISAVMVVMIDINQNVILINKKGCEILGYREEEVIGENWFDHFLPEGLRDEVKRVFNKLISGEVEPVEYYENEVLTKKGELKMIAWYNTVFRNEKGEITQTMASGADITDRKKAEEEREQLIRELKDALAKVKTLSGLIPICSSCQKIRDDKGYWELVADYMSKHSDAQFSHGICPECAKRLYPKYYKEKDPLS